MKKPSESPLAGIAFDDTPIILPTAKNFELAMNAVAQEFGGSCGTIESYGWKMQASEQERVNRTFGVSVDRLKTLGYKVEPRAPKAVTRDVTVFTAQRSDRNLVFMWSAGEVGLVLLICDLHSGPAPAKATRPASAEAGSSGIPSSAATVDIPEPKPEEADLFPNFTPVGTWIGGYTCAQGYTGGTLTIARVQGESFNGTFRFYPTPQNPMVESGKYYVSGSYDKVTKRILVSPGAWIQHPKDYYQAIMVGRFFPDRSAFSGVFQGISGCTSFEGKLSGKGVSSNELGAEKPKKKKPAKKKAAPKKADDVKPVIIEGSDKPSEVAKPDDTAGVTLGDPKPEEKAAPEVPKTDEPSVPDLPKLDEKPAEPKAEEPKADATPAAEAPKVEDKKAEPAPAPETPASAAAQPAFVEPKADAPIETPKDPVVLAPAPEQEDTAKPATEPVVLAPGATEGTKPAEPAPAATTTGAPAATTTGAAAATTTGEASTKSVEDVLKPPSELPAPPAVPKLDQLAPVLDSATQ